MLHETTRKRIGRAAFFALCIAPSLATAAWVLERRLPGAESRQAAALSELLQTTAAVAGWREPRPGAVGAAQVSLSDRRDGAWLARADAIQWRTAEGQCFASADDVAVACDGFDRLAEQVDRWLGLLPQQALRFRWKRLAIVEAGADAEIYALRDVEVVAERLAAGGVRLQLTGRPASDQPQSAPLRLTAEIPGARAEGEAHVALEAPSAIPARLFAAFAPGFGALGEEATFSGVFGGRVSDGAFHGGATGRLHGVDLAAALPKGSPHRVLGMAQIDLSEMRWRQNRIELLAGRLSMRDGMASHSLIAAASEFMLCVRSSAGAHGRSDSSEELLAVDELRCKFSLGAAGLLLEGDFPAESGLGEGCLASSGGRALVLQPGRGPAPAGAWIQFLLGRSESWLPATRQAVEIAERLPMPDGVVLHR